MSMFKGKEPAPMKLPKEVAATAPGALVPRNVGEPVPFAPESHESDHDAEGNFLNAHRRLKGELAEAKKLASEAVIELKARGKIIERLEADLLDCRNRVQDAENNANQAREDCAVLENLFQNIAAMTDSFLKPREIKREQETVEQSMVKKVKEIIEEKHE